MEVGDLPPEASTAPQQLIVLMNFDIKNNDEHKSIWDAFVNNRRSDRLPFNFKVADSTHVFPRPKPKKNPDGSAVSSDARYIWKSNWFYKHVHLVPAVVVLFMDLDWDNPSFNEKKQECASKVDAIRHSLMGRETKISIVLVQKSPPLPTDSIFAQRANELCSQCDISLKCLFVLPLTDHLFGYILRLEHAFYELAGSYYQSVIKNVKLARDASSKFNDLNLLIRYQIKLGFFNELRQDTHSALRHYKQAYQHLLDVKIDDLNVLDVKIVAGLLNFKISKMCFSHGTPLDAIGHFRKHIDNFRDVECLPGLEFEYYGWLSKQFAIFADLFDSAIQNGLAALQTQHPGFYYQSAAEYATWRRGCCGLTRGSDSIHSTVQSPSIPPYLRETYGRISNFRPIFYGLRPWHASLTEYPSVHAMVAGQSSPDVVCDKEAAILFFQWRECNQVDHFGAILHYLNAAAAQYKRYKCYRMRLLIMVRMSELYMSVGDYEKALQILSPVVWEYRNERWFLLLRHASRLAVKCAYRIRNVKAYVCLLLELCSPYLLIPLEEKTRLQRNLLLLLDGLAPENVQLNCDWSLTDPPRNSVDPSRISRPTVPEPYRASDAIATSPFTAAGPAPDLASDPVPEPDSDRRLKNAWAETLDVGCFFHVLMHNIFSFIDVGVRFDCAEIFADEVAVLFVHIRLSCPLPMKFSKLSIQFENKVYEPFCVISQENQPFEDPMSLVFEPNCVKKFRFEFAPFSIDVGKDIKITSLTLDVGKAGSKVYGNLQWENFDRTLPFIQKEYCSVASALRGQGAYFDTLKSSTALKVSPRKSNLALNFYHTPPILIGELYKITLVVKNLETSVISSVNIRLEFLEDSGGKAEFLSDALPRSDLDFQFLIMQTMEEKSIDLTIRCNVPLSPLPLSCIVSYSTEIDTKFGSTVCQCSSSSVLNLDVISPFVLLNPNLFTFKGEPVDRLVLHEPILVSCELKCISSFSLGINSLEWDLASHLAQEAPVDPLDSQNCLHTNDALNLIHCVKPVQSCGDQPKSLGALRIVWQRKCESSIDGPQVETSLDLASYSVESCPLLVSLNLPAFSCVRHSFPVSYELRNLTHSILEISLSLESSDYFMFAGEKQLSISMLPESKIFIPYVYLPLTAGQAVLPRLKITSASYAQDIFDRYSQRNVPNAVFILPFAKQDCSDAWIEASKAIES